MFLVLKCKYHHWVHQETPYGFWWVVETKDLWMKFIVTILTSWNTVLHCVRTKTTWMMCVSNLQNLPSRTVSKRRLNLQACVGKPLPEQGSPSLLEKQLRQRQQQSYVNTSRSIYVKKWNKEDRFWTTIPRYRNARRVQLRLASPSVSRIWQDTMTNMNEKQIEKGIGMVYSQCRKGSSDINWRKSSLTRTGSIAFILKASRQNSKSEKWNNRVKIHSFDPRTLSSLRLMICVMILHTWKWFIYQMGRARDQYSMAEFVLVAERK